MNVDQLDLIFYDICGIDVQMPPMYGKWTNEYKKMSYSRWAIEELETFILKKISPRRTGSIKEFCDIIHEFIKNMSRYSKKNPNTGQIFQYASETASDILDVLYDMKGGETNYEQQLWFSC